MPETTFPDVVAIVADHLRTELPAAGFPGPVVALVPNPRPDTFTRVRRAGGVRQNLVTDGATLTVECYAPDEAAALDRAQVARGIVHDMPGGMFNGTPVYRVNETAGPGTLPDPDSLTPRVTMTLEVWCRGTHP